MNPNNTANSSNPKSILITVDVEDWFQVENLRQVFPIERWNANDLRIEKNTHLLLELFDRHNIRATFFFLGWIAERIPGLVKAVRDCGHEIASHGHNHELCTGLAVSKLREDLYRSKTTLEEITGEPVSGYRAPSFSVTRELVEILGDLGYRYDSSYNNFAMNKRYGQANGLFQSMQNGSLVANNGIIELPISNLKLYGQTIPWGGGGYFRLYPPIIFSSGVAHLLKNNGYYNLYCHPWEFDPEQPRANGVSTLNRFRHYHNLAKTFNRLEHFLEKFKHCNFVTCSQHIDVHNHPIS